MRDLDRLIDEALDGEERELLRGIGEEQGYMAQVTGLFVGRTGWVSALLMLVQGFLFIAGVWAGWHFFEATDLLAALRWGLPAGVMLLMSLTIKMAMWPTLHLNRLMREMKRIELQIARSTHR